MKKVLLNIVGLRRKAGVSQRILAEKLGMSTTAYGKIERGETILNFDHVARIASALGISEETVLAVNFPEDEDVLREQTFKDSLVRSLREQNDELNSELLAARAEIADKDNQLSEVRELNAFLKQKIALYERHPSSD